MATSTAIQKSKLDEQFKHALAELGAEKAAELLAAFDPELRIVRQSPKDGEKHVEIKRRFAAGTTLSKEDKKALSLLPKVLGKVQLPAEPGLLSRAEIDAIGAAIVPERRNKDAIEGDCDRFRTAIFGHITAATKDPTAPGVVFSTVNGVKFKRSFVEKPTSVAEKAFNLSDEAREAHAEVAAVFGEQWAEVSDIRERREFDLSKYFVLKSEGKLTEEQIEFVEAPPRLEARFNVDPITEKDKLSEGL